MSVETLTAVTGISTVLGLLSLLAYLFFLLQMRGMERSLERVVRGEGLFNSEQVVKILAQFSDDAHRLEALKELTGFAAKDVEAFLAKVKNNVDLNRLSSKSDARNLRLLMISAALFLALAILSVGYRVLRPDNGQAEGMSDSHRRISTSSGKPDAQAKSHGTPRTSSLSPSALKIVLVGPLNRVRINPCLENAYTDPTKGLIVDVYGMPPNSFAILRTVARGRGDGTPNAAGITIPINGQTTPVSDLGLVDDADLVLTVNGVSATIATSHYLGPNKCADNETHFSPPSVTLNSK